MGRRERLAKKIMAASIVGTIVVVALCVGIVYLDRDEKVKLRAENLAHPTAQAYNRQCRAENEELKSGRIESEVLKRELSRRVSKTLKGLRGGTDG